jgi:hypothetical protein
MGYFGDLFGKQPAEGDKPEQDNYFYDLFSGRDDDTDMAWRKKGKSDEPDYGTGFSGWLNGIKSRIGAKSYEKLSDGTYREVNPNVLNVAARSVGEAVGQTLKGFDFVTEKFQELGSASQTLDDIADESNSWLPDITKSERAKTLAKIIPGASAVNMLYDTARIFTGSKKLAWEDIKRTAEINAAYAAKLSGTELAQGLVKPFENTAFGKSVKDISAKSMAANEGQDLSAGRNLFSDANARAEFVRRVRAGESIEKVTAEMSNPLGEMVYDMVVDPTNIAGGFIDDFFKARKLAAAAKGYEAIDEVKDSWKALGTIANKADEVPVFTNMAQKIIAKNTKADAALFDTSDLWKANRLTNTGKAERMADTVDTVFKPILAAFKTSPDDLGEAVRATALIGSKDANQVKEGLELFRGLNSKIGELVTSENGLQTAQFLNRLLTDDAGKVTGRFMEEVIDAARAGDLTKTMEKWTQLSDKVLKEMYPSVIDMAKQPDKYKVPSWALNVAKAHEAAQTNIAGPINKYFSTVYLSLSPGYSIRNTLNNIVTAAIDFNGSVAADTVAGFGQKLTKSTEPLLQKIDELQGFMGRRTDTGLSKSGEELGKDKGLFSKLTGKIREINDQSEQAASVAVVYASLKRTLGKAFKEGVALADASQLRQLGIKPDQVNRLLGLVETNKGNVDKALEVWMGEGANGVIDTFRDVRSILNPADIQDAKNTPGLMESIEAVLAAPTKDDAVKAINDIRADWAKKAAKDVDGNLPHIYDGDPIGTDIGEAFDAGLSEATGNLFNTKLRVQRTATNKLNEAVEKIFDNINVEAGGDNGVRSALKVLRENMRTTRAGIAQKVTAEVDQLRNQVRAFVRGNESQIDRKALASIPGYGEWRKAHTELGSKDALWTYYFDTRKRVRDGELAQYADAWGKMLSPGGELSNLVGRDLMQEDAMKLAQLDIEDAIKVMQADKIDKTGVWVDGVKQALNAGNPVGAIRAQAAQFGIGSISDAGKMSDKAILNIINANLPEGAPKIIRLADIDFDTAQTALQAHAKKHNITAKLNQVGVPVMEGQMPTPGQAARANLPGVKSLLNRLEAGVNSKWGRGSAISELSPAQIAAVNAWKTETAGRVAKTRAVAARVAMQERDFALLNYGQKTSIDHALAYIMPYQFWYNRSYQNWAKRLVQHPQVLSRYASYKKYLEKEHAGLPDWWKNNVSFNDLPGVDVENPMYMNLEATLNPLNGLMGVDFNDSNKLVGDPGTFEYYMTRTLDGIGKFGPSVWTPISMAAAGYLATKGEQDAAQRWAGRILPQSLPIKALASLAGKNIDIDPMIWISSGKGLKGYDAYEARRIGRSMGALIENGEITPEQAIEAMHNQSGEIFEKAQLKATQDRALTGTLAGYFLGVGFKQRSASDMQIDKFYEDYNQLWQNQDKLTASEFKVSMDKIREMYPFMDTVLLSKKGGWERDRAYAYTVMGRIAPGDTSNILKSAGLPADIIDKFYSEKGNIGAWKEDDRLKFMGAMISIGTTLKIPSSATQEEWTQAKSAYKSLSEGIAASMGRDIWDKVDVYYNLNDREKDAYLKLHPEVAQAMDYKSYAVANSPILARYYNGLSNIEDYYKGEFKREVTARLGANYYDILKQRQAILDPKELAAFDRANNIKASGKIYDALKKSWDARIDRELLNYGNNLPPAIKSSFQTDLNMADLSTGQQAIVNAVQPDPTVQWQDISTQVPEMLTVAFDKYFTNDRPFTSAEKSMLTRTAKYLGISADDLMRMYRRSQP